MDEELEIDQLLKAFALNYAAYEHQQEARRLLLTFLDVLASFDRCFSAIEEAPEEPVASSWLRSFDRVRDQLCMTLEQAGVGFMHCVGQAFDPTRHEAVEVRTTSDVEENTILEEIVRGCEWRGEVLCYAKVVVASKTQRGPNNSSSNQKEI